MVENSIKKELEEIDYGVVAFALMLFIFICLFLFYVLPQFGIFSDDVQEEEVIEEDFNCSCILTMYAPSEDGGVAETSNMPLGTDCTFIAILIVNESLTEAYSEVTCGRE